MKKGDHKGIWIKKTFIFRACFFFVLLLIGTPNHAIMPQRHGANYCRTCTSQLTIIARRKLHISFCKKGDDVLENSATVAAKHSNESIFEHEKIDDVTSNMQVNNVKRSEVRTILML